MIHERAVPEAGAQTQYPTSTSTAAPTRSLAASIERTQEAVRTLSALQAERSRLTHRLEVAIRAARSAARSAASQSPSSSDVPRLSTDGDAGVRTTHTSTKLRRATDLMERLALDPHSNTDHAVPQCQTQRPRHAPPPTGRPRRSTAAPRPPTTFPRPGSRPPAAVSGFTRFPPSFPARLPPSVIAGRAPPPPLRPSSYRRPRTAPTAPPAPPAPQPRHSCGILPHLAPEQATATPETRGYTLPPSTLTPAAAPPPPQPTYVSCGILPHFAPQQRPTTAEGAPTRAAALRTAASTLLAAAAPPVPPTMEPAAAAAAAPTTAPPVAEPTATVAAVVAPEPVPATTETETETETAAPSGGEAEADEAAPTEPEECAVCCENVCDATISGCGHKFCRSCVKTYIQLSVVTSAATHLTLECPEDSCSNKLTATDLFAYSTAPVREKLEENSLRACLSSMDDYKPCPTCTKGGFVSSEACTDAECPSGHSFCTKCLRSSHVGMSCEDFQGTEESKCEEWKSGHARRCPKCCTWIEKKGGCSHMTCRSCSYQFCWLCMGKYQGKYTTGNTCPCPPKSWDDEPAES